MTRTKITGYRCKLDIPLDKDKDLIFEQSLSAYSKKEETVSFLVRRIINVKKRRIFPIFPIPISPIVL